METTSVIHFKSPPLPFFIESVQMSIDKGNGYLSRSNLGVFNLIYVRKGSLYIDVNNQSYIVERGQYIVLRPDHKMKLVQTCVTDTVIEDIQFNATVAWEEVDGQQEQQLFGDYYSHILHVKHYHTVKQMKKFEQHMDKLRRAALSGEADSFMERQIQFIHLLKLLDEEWRESEARAAVTVAEKAASYIKQHYNVSLTNGMIAEDIGYHINYISRSMDEVFGMTPQQYLAYYRIDQAKLLLIRTDLSVADIAQQIGFKQTPHFSRLFAHYAGISPLKYRKKYTA